MNDCTLRKPPLDLHAYSGPAIRAITCSERNEPHGWQGRSTDERQCRQLLVIQSLSPVYSGRTASEFERGRFPHRGLGLEAFLDGVRGRMLQQFVVRLAGGAPLQMFGRLGESVLVREVHAQ